jgi:GR25 family glycosyltransferase involved in LPS biosynthesis
MADTMITDPAAAFERVYCVNLDRCSERWKRFAEALPSDWPWPVPVRFAGVDGQRVQPPPAWQAGRGAWGVYRSFLAILERCLSDAVDSVLLLEDDALFRPDFVAEATAWLRHVPENWQMLYLGGQHLASPRKLTDQLWVAQNVNRCHAWAVRGSMLAEVYHHLLPIPFAATRSGKAAHIDHQLGRLHAKHYAAHDTAVLCPPRWLVGQAAGRSTIANRDVEDRFWRDAAQVSKAPIATAGEAPARLADRPVIVVLGPFRGGTSCTAGLLHQLGVNMGASWSTIRGNPKGTFEARQLAQFCRQAYQEPQLTERMSRSRRVAGLRKWLEDRVQAVPAPAPIGAKHPSLCLMVPEILEVAPAAKFVAVQRPIPECVASLAKLKNWGWPAADIYPTLRRMVETRDRDLAALSADRVLRIDYAAIVADPAAAVRTLAAFAGVDPDPDTLATSAAWVDPMLKTV